ncbi:hypothetical protein Mettu_0950 [Methylobacter tundripaludum SV96]|uniref:Uncharacterized protein n=1 Tax=Methylobacter tundripaludum (strain ATCC BAA-1195 / DSM 17260 / SV96) TaxID=697282 RepID=G3IRD8_METTV|nr:hypothetical protein Mettu_0950 [Methylobacter tundripaludum SV96]
MICSIEKEYRRGVIGTDFVHIIWVKNRYVLDIFKLRFFGIGFKTGFCLLKKIHNINLTYKINKGG